MAKAHLVILHEDVDEARLALVLDAERLPGLDARRELHRGGPGHRLQPALEGAAHRVLHLLAGEGGCGGLEGVASRGRPANAAQDQDQLKVSACTGGFRFPVSVYAVTYSINRNWKPETATASHCDAVWKKIQLALDRQAGAFVSPQHAAAHTRQDHGPSNIPKVAQPCRLVD